MRKIIASLLISTVIFSGCRWFKKNPQKAVNAGIAKFVDVEKMGTSLLVKGTVIGLPGERPAKVQFTLEITGSSDVSNEKSPKVDIQLKLKGSFDEKKASGEGQFRVIDGKLFFNVSSIDSGGEAGTLLKEQLSSVLNRWWSVPLGDKTPIGKLTKERKELQEKIKSMVFFKNAKEEGVELIRDIPSKKYRVDLDKEVLKNFLLEVARVGGNQITPDEESAIAQSLKDIEFSGAIWVGDDTIVHRIMGTIVVQPAQGPSSSFDIDYTGWNYGKNITVAEPEQVTEFNPFMLLPIASLFKRADPAPQPDIMQTKPETKVAQ